MKRSATTPRHTSSGFTLIELLVVIALFVVMAAVATPSLRDGGGKITADDVAYRVALGIREMQLYGTSVLQYVPLAGSPYFETGQFRQFGYGLYFLKGASFRYIRTFADIGPLIDAEPDPLVTILRSDGKFQTGTDPFTGIIHLGKASIGEICFNNGFGYDCSPVQARIIFLRPDPYAYITDTLGTFYDEVRIRLDFPNNIIRYVYVMSGGQIRVI